MGNCFGNSPANDPIFMLEDDDEIQEHVTLGQNQPLIHEAIIWKGDVPLTEGQVRGKRDTFWETAPVYDGRKEIWDALKAAAEAAESEDYDLAQAIVTGAGILLPKGKLTDTYDELGNRYVIPPYCLSRPSNMQHTDTANTGAVNNRVVSKEQVTLKIRLSTQPKDFKHAFLKSDSIREVKDWLQEAHNVGPRGLKMFLSGRLLTDDVLIGDLDIPKGFVIQAIVG